MGRLCAEGPLSATRLAEDARVSRQAVAKHLRVLAAAALVSDARAGRESLWSLELRGLEAARRSLDAISREWDARLERLRALVESPAPVTPPRAPAAGTPAPPGTRPIGRGVARVPSSGAGDVRTRRT